MSSQTQAVPDFRFETDKCPACGGAPDAVLEKILGWATIDDAGDYAGYTDVLWDSQETDTFDDGSVQVRCSECREIWQTQTIN